jgi:hypothetical protein
MRLYSYAVTEMYIEAKKNSDQSHYLKVSRECKGALIAALRCLLFILLFSFSLSLKIFLI